MPREPLSREDIYPWSVKEQQGKEIMKTSMLKYGHILLCAAAGLALACASACSSDASDKKNEPVDISAQTAKHKGERKFYYSDPLGYKETEIHKAGSTRQAPYGKETRIRVNNIGPLAEVFNDSNKYQYAWAERIGIEPITDIGSAFRTRRPLRRLQTCDAYVLDNLTHSMPYLVPEAEDLLRTIGYNFIDSLARRGGGGYRIKVTSVLRTPATVKSLKRVNKNATDSSTHQFGTTFDISWARFVCSDSTRTINEGDLKNLLAEVLLDLKNRKQCMVKFERKSPCFHITVSKPE